MRPLKLKLRSFGPFAGEEGDGPGGCGADGGGGDVGLDDEGLPEIGGGGFDLHGQGGGFDDGDDDAGGGGGGVGSVAGVFGGEGVSAQGEIGEGGD